MEAPRTLSILILESIHWEYDMGFSLKGSPDLSAISASEFTTRVVVGYPDDVMHYSGQSMADLGELMEAGDAKTPARPHLEEGIEANMPWIQEHVEAYFRSPRKHRKGFQKDASGIGKSMVEAVRAYVYSGALAPNSPITIAKKGSDQPLVDKFVLLKNLTYRVLRMGGSRG